MRQERTDTAVLLNFGRHDTRETVRQHESRQIVETFEQSGLECHFLEGGMGGEEEDFRREGV